MRSGASDLTKPATVFHVGQLIGGRYEIISLLGHGGMALVYRVRQIHLNKEFALKTIDRSNMSGLTVQRFQQEARTAFSLQHPSIIAVHDFGLLDDGTPFLAMELVRGKTLAEQLQENGAMTLEEAIPIFVQVCFGLAYAHECGVVHRDIKPSNVMLLKGLPQGTEGSVKILDFGIAKFTGHEGGEIQELTRTGEVFGSPLYMSPEQCSGFRVDHRADIYSLGCVMFEALTGTPPFVGTTALATMLKHQGERAPSLKEASLGGSFPRGIEEIVATMLAKSPDQRYNNLGQVAYDLGALRRGESTSQVSKSPSSPPPEANTVTIGRASFYALVAGVAILSAMVAGVSGYVLHKTGNSGEQNRVQYSTLAAAEPDSLTEYEHLSQDELRLKLDSRKTQKTFILKCNKITPRSIELIGDAKWIEQLVLKDCDIENGSFSGLKKLPLLTGINLTRSIFDDSCAEQLATCSNLQEVIVNLTDLSDRKLASLAKIHNLKMLSMVCSKVTNEGLLKLQKCEKLKKLNLSNSRQITSRGLSALKNLNLEELNLKNCPVDNSALAEIAKIRTLTAVNLNETHITKDGVMKFLHDSGCKDISLQRCRNISTIQIEELRREFPQVVITSQDDSKDD